MKSRAFRVWVLFILIMTFFTLVIGFDDWWTVLQMSVSYWIGANLGIMDGREDS